jgi:acyl-CoA thioesterase-1
LFAMTWAILTVSAASAAEVVALGASNTYGQGVDREQAYPEQLQAMLAAHGQAVTVANAGISGDTTGSMLARFDSVVGSDTRVLVLQPGGNDVDRAETIANVAQIKQKAVQHGIAVVMVPNLLLFRLPKQPDEMHLTPEGYRTVAQTLLPQVLQALRKRRK